MRHALLSVCLTVLAEWTTHTVATSSGSIEPLSVPTTEAWDGDDGRWSSFAIQIGSPPQSVRVFPSTGTNAFWPVLPGGCPAQSLNSCPRLRGSLFYPNKSDTWQPVGKFGLGLYAEKPLGYSVGGLFGYDDVRLGYPGQGLPKLSRQVVQGFVAPDFYLGSFGLDVSAINISRIENHHPSPLSWLYHAEAIPSASWGYTAGAFYREIPIFGSLVLGGYDQSRFTPNSLSIPFGPDQSRRFLVGIQSIVSDKSVGNALAKAALLPGGIISYIDSLVPEIWLPLDACKAFETAFNLTWVAELELYLVSDEQHDKLTALNPTITFTIAADLKDSNIVEIALPYASFDLIMKPPGPGIGSHVLGSPVRYFPLKRAQHIDQYTLGRTFLQEAYLISDYHRKKFSISQAAFPANSNTQHLVAIAPPAREVNATAPPAPSRNGIPETSAGLGTGAIVGIVFGIVFAILLGALIAFLVYRHRSLARKRRQGSTDQKQESSYSEASETGEQQRVADSTHSEESACNELEAKDPATELDGGFGVVEMSEGRQQRPELQGRFTENFTEDDFPVDRKEPYVDQDETDGSDLVSPITGVFSPTIAGLVSPIASQFGHADELESPIAELDGTPVDQRAVL